MSKLTKEQIGFIDNYLKNSGIEYLDIRYEMTDHVASTLEVQEGDFYKNFSNYMLANKKGLLESNRNFSRIAGNRALKLLGRNIISIRYVVIVAMLWMTALAGRKYFEMQQIVESLGNVYTLLFIGICLYYIYTNIFSRKKVYSMLDKLIGTVGAAVYFFILPAGMHRWLGSEVLLLLYYCLLTAFAILFFITCRQLKKQYKVIYNG